MDGSPTTTPGPSAPGTQSALGTLPPGAGGTVTAFGGPHHDNAEDMIDRLREMGFAEGLKVKVLHHSPFGRDPIVVRTGGMTVALRRREANLVRVQLA